MMQSQSPSVSGQPSSEVSTSPSVSLAPSNKHSAHPSVSAEPSSHPSLGPSVSTGPGILVLILVDVCRSETHIVAEIGF